MTVANTLQQHLTSQGVRFDVLEHPPAYSSSQTAQVCHVSGDQYAKAVVLKGDGGYVLAVLPASHHADLVSVRSLLQRDLELASEAEASRIFADCETGALPADGPAYGLETIVDESLAALSDVYIEGGDHRSLLHLSGSDFGRLLADARRGEFSRHD